LVTECAFRRRPRRFSLYTITAWTPLVNAVHESAWLLTTSEGLEFAVALDADLQACLRGHLPLLDAAARDVNALMPRQSYTVLWPLDRRDCLSVECHPVRRPRHLPTPRLEAPGRQGDPRHPPE
jgi:hypothetical protein